MMVAAAPIVEEMEPIALAEEVRPTRSLAAGSTSSVRRERPRTPRSPGCTPSCCARLASRSAPAPDVASPTRRRARRHRGRGCRRCADERPQAPGRLSRRQQVHHLGLQVRIARGCRRSLGNARGRAARCCSSRRRGRSSRARGSHPSWKRSKASSSRHPTCNRRRLDAAPASRPRRAGPERRADRRPRRPFGTIVARSTRRSTTHVESSAAIWTSAAYPFNRLRRRRDRAPRSERDTRGCSASTSPKSVRRLLRPARPLRRARARRRRCRRDTPRPARPPAGCLACREEHEASGPRSGDLA